MNGGELAVTIIGATGGSGAVVTVVGRILLARIAQAQREAHEKALAAWRSELDSRNAQQLVVLESRLEVISAREIRISEARFQLYSEVWSRMQDVRTVADRLWEQASMSELERFISALSDARMAVNRGRLILRESHYGQLQELLDMFENFQTGKDRLIKLRDAQALEEIRHDYSEDHIGYWIDQNRSTKERYESLLDEIAAQFREQLGLAA